MASTKVLAQLEAWRKELINLNRRNALLYFKHTRAATLQLSERTPDQLLAGFSVSGGWGFELSAVEGQQPPTLRPGHVRTNKTDPVSQENALHNLERRCVQQHLDKGLWVLYLGLGMLVWKDPRDPREARSPLFLVPVSLTRESPRAPYVLRAVAEDQVVNPALDIKLRNDFGIELPGLDVAEGGTLDAYFGAVRTATSDLDSRVECTAVLAPFSFHKEVMFRDLQDNAAAIAEHPVIRVLADPSSDAGESLAFDPIPDERLDAEAPPEDMASVLPADASQRRCIVAAKSGRSFVMDGPPGTGKSQTIANIISELLRDGRTVLFVSEKAAALEVVRNRLVAARLGEFVLELHSHKATRKEVARELGRALAQRVIPGTELSQLDRREAQRRREALSAYADAMNEPRDSPGSSLHGVLGRISALAEAPAVTSPTGFARDMTPKTRYEALEHAGALGRAWSPVDRGEDFLWRGVTGNRPRSRLLLDLRGAVSSVRERAQLLAAETRLPQASTPVELRDSLPLYEHIADSPDVPAGWLSDPDLTAVDAAVAQVGELQTQLRRASAALVVGAGESWRALEPSRHQVLTRSLAALRESGWPSAPHLDAASARRLEQFLRDSSSALKALQSRTNAIAWALGLPADDVTLDRAEQLCQLGALAGSPHRPEPEWLDPKVQDALTLAASILSALVDEYRTRERNLTEVFDPAVLDLDLAELDRRFRDVHKGFRKWGDAFRADRKLVAAVSRTGRATKDVRDHLSEAGEWQALSRRLQEAERQHAAIIGEGYYRHTATDFNAVVAAIEVARQAVALVGRDATQPGVRDQLALGGSADALLPQESSALLQDLRSWRAQAHQQLGQDPPLLSMAGLGTWIDETVGRLRDIIEHVDHVQAVTGRTFQVSQALDVLRARQLVADTEAEVDRSAADWRDLLGPHFAGLETDLGAVAQDLSWARQLREMLTEPLPLRTAESVLNARPDALAARANWSHWNRLCEELLDLFEPDVCPGMQRKLDGAFRDVSDYLTELARTVGDVDEWIAYQNATTSLAALGLGEVVQDLIELRAPATQVRSAIERAALQAWVDHTMKSDPRLAVARAADRDDLVAQFRALDTQLVESASASVIAAVNKRRPQTITGVPGIIQREAVKKSRHMPVRDLLRDTAAVTQRLKPCFMMSPLTVSQFLTNDISFDVVIFDEASQVHPADAVSCIYRAQQVIVAGDQKQLPPTSFFMGGTASDDDEYDEDQVDEFESVLDLCKGSAGFPSLPLRWHYRSQHESLITFSNYRFYGGDLVTFPGAVSSAPDVGVEFMHVPEGMYRRGGPRDNPREAAAVVERVLAHAQEHPHLTCGVVAFSEAQAAAIALELDRARTTRPHLDSYFDGDRLDGFFVKNLESVQGDERDIIVFSVGYGPDEYGKITNNFGPVNRSGGWRRLNVAATRARRRVEVVSSIRAGDIRNTGNESLLHLKCYLDYAARGMPALAVEMTDSHGVTESPFEDEVLGVIRAWGYEVVPQVGSAGYRIDMAVRHPKRPGSYALGVECDGVMYHSSKVARDRDRLREEVLRGLGWRLHRIWGTAWYRDGTREQERLHEAIRQAIQHEFAPTSGSTRAVLLPVALEEVVQLDLEHGRGADSRT